MHFCEMQKLGTGIMTQKIIIFVIDEYAMLLLYFLRDFTSVKGKVNFL